MPLAKAGGITELNNRDNDMSEQNANFVQRQRDAELEYNLLLVDAVRTAVKGLRERLTSDVPAYKRTAESLMNAGSRKMLRDVEDSIWKLSFEIDQKHYRK